LKRSKLEFRFGQGSGWVNPEGLSQSQRDRTTTEKGLYPKGMEGGGKGKREWREDGQPGEAGENLSKLQKT